MPSRAGATSVAPMINRLSHATIWVLDQDEALAFYTGKLGFEVRTDQRIDDFRWVTVGPPGQPDLEIVLLVPGPPMMPPEAAEQIKAVYDAAQPFSGGAAAACTPSPGDYESVQRTTIDVAAGKVTSLQPLTCATRCVK